jgi:hypothetical protein
MPVGVLSSAETAVEANISWSGCPNRLAADRPSNAAQDSLVASMIPDVG